MYRYIYIYLYINGSGDVYIYISIAIFGHMFMFVCMYVCISQFFSAGDEDVTDTGAPKAKGAEPIDGFPPTFTEKPKIVPNESGTLVTILQNFLRPQFTSVRNKLECLFLAFLSRLGQCLWVRQGAYSRMEHAGRLWPHSKTSH
jgi:hypothetical protein